MPIFDLKCSKCTEVREYIIRHSEIENMKSECCNAPVSQQISGGTDFKLRGGNWPGQDIGRTTYGSKHVRSVYKFD